MSFEFVIPLQQSDLLKATGTNQYVVEDLCASRQIADKVFGCKSLMRNEGPLMLLENFDIFYSVLRQFKDINSEVKEMAWELLISMCRQQTQNVASYLEDDQLDSVSSHRHLNFVKMNLYLLSQMAEAFETDATRPSSNIASSNKGGRKKTTNIGFDWDNERENFINIISQPIHLDIYRLWDPPIAEEEFVNLIANCCYKLLENPVTCRNKTSRDAIFNLIGALVKRYNHTLSASLKFTQLLQHFEHLSGPLAEAIALITTNFGVKNIVNEILREIGSMDPKDLARDNSGTRSYAAFLVELAERIPTIMLPSISVLLCHLDGESYTMRNSMLGVIGEIVLQVLSGDTLDSKAKTTRDQLLDKLEDHIHDVNAFTRSKALQVWLRMCNERAIPLTRQRELLPLVIGRLQDKSSVVRKSAVQLLTALMVSNPFAAKLSVIELQDSLDKESKKLEEMLPEEGIPNIPVNTGDDWEAIETEVIKAIQESTEESEDMENVEIPESKDIKSIVAEIRKLLEAREFDNALNLLNAAKEAWSDHEMFNNTPPTDEDIAMETNNMDPDVEKMCSLLKSIFLGFTPLAMNSANMLVGTDPHALIGGRSEGDACQNSVVNELTKQQILVQYFKDCVAFASQLQEAVPIICQQLGSKATTDVMEAIGFFVTAFEFGISNSMQGVRGMMALVWSKDQSVKDAVVSAYHRLYLTPKGGNERSRSMAIVNNLTALTVGATIGELTSLEELVVQFVKSNDIPKQAIQLLWERFTMKLEATTEEESRGAIIIIGMAAGADIDIVRSNVDVLVGTGLGPRAEMDFTLARYTCSALLKLAGSGKPKVMSSEVPFRFASSHAIFTRLSDILTQGIDNLKDSYWQPFADQAVNTIYRLSEHPDSVCGNILKKLATHIMRIAGEDSVNDEGMESSNASCPAAVLSRFLGFSGQVALQQLVHLDVMVTSELKRRHYVQEKANGSENRNKTKTENETNDPGAIEDELGLTGATAEDAESEYIRKICESESVTGPNLLSAVRPLLVAVCSNPSKYKDPSLRTSACLALAKFMLVSSEFCDAHLQLLFTVLEKSPEEVIRANTIIAIGDLTFRFPNLIEPWTANLYARLRDESVHVRKNTLMVLTHLILNDMVKVKGQISEMATCMVDTEPRIAALAKLFFFELSKKGNAVYNVMPDIISRLSDPDCGLPEEDFRTIMKYLFTFIQKERQSESLVEKLCHRFRATRTPVQVRDLSYCLSMLNYSEKGVKRLVENFACFSDKLADVEVFSCFQTILTKAKKLTKPELKVFVEDFEERITRCHTKGVEDDEIVAKATKAASKLKRGGSQNQSTPAASRQRRTAKSTAKSTVKRTTRRGRRRQQKDSDSEDDENTMPLRETAVDPANCNPGRSVRKTRIRKPKGVILSSDEDSDEEEVLQSMLTKVPRFGLDESTGSETENSAPNRGPTTASGYKKGKRKLLSTPDGARGSSSRL
ncbi:condensin complex subunit 1-like isoform X2 [Anneissia japonica]|uniref:condensin complex subunit 1-like isoform X2 n=1 Tax=Anneissia japonica TaxID=1529436 RepID=UPI00142577C9|nr:condensin complex subunit 1-like isoform X2 [Anneissia japonica]